MTTPGGVPNLPVGALTLDNLAARLQDMTPPAIRNLANQGLPSVFNLSNGGNVLSDLTPFGIITRIFAEFASAVANADPADIQGPDDLPGLLHNFIEELPVIGELVGLLEAIMGTYDGDDAVLIAVQEIFFPIRKLLQLVSGQPVGFPTIEEVTVGWTDLNDALIARATEFANLLAAAGQVTATELGALLQALIEFLTAIPANLLSGALPTAVTVSGNPIGTLLSNINSSGQFAASQVTGALNTAITVGGTTLGTLIPGGQLAASQLTGALNGAVTFGGTALSTLLQNLTGTGQFAASQLTGALNTAVTVGGTALSTLIPGGQLAASQLTGAINGAVTLGGTTLSTLVTNINSSGQLLASGITGALGTSLTVGGVTLSTLFTNINSSGQLLLSGATGALNTAVTVGGTQIGTLLQYLNSSGQFNAAQLTGAINTAATIGGTALSTLTTNWNAAVTDVNSLISGVGGTVIADVNTYLQNVPNTAVQGLTGFGTNIGNTIQALSDGVWQGLRAFLGVPSGVAPPQVATAAQQVRVDLNNATDIATLARTIQAAQAITKQSFLSIDPSADPVFPLSNIIGSSPTTVPVVATKTVMGCVLLPDVSTKKSITWLGGPLTNITGVYVNLYTVNKTTGVFTPFHASANIISSLSNPVSGTAWNFYNLPMTDYFDVTVDGTGGNTTTVLGIGDYVVVEIVTVGSGTYNVVGFTNGIPTHTSIYPKGLGASRVPSYATVAYDAVGGGAKSPTSAPTVDAVGAGGTSLSSVGTVSYSHTIASDATCILIGVVQAGTSGNATVTVGGVAATQVKYSFITTDFYVSVYALMNPPTGTKTVTVTLAGNYLTSNSVSYKGVTGIGLGVSANSSGTSPTQTISATANTMVFQVLGAQGINSFSAYSKTSRWSLAGSANSCTTLVGDFIGSSGSNTGSATLSGSTNWASAMVPLIGGGNPISWTHTATAGAYVVAAVAIGSDWNYLPATPSATVTYGGTAMTLLGSVAMNNTGTAGIVALYGLANAPGGAKTVTVTGAISGAAIDNIAGNTVSYTNVANAATVTNNYGTTTSMSVSATGVTAGRVVNALACNAQPATYGQLTFTSYSGTSRSVNTPQVSSQEVALLIGDSGTVGSISFTATETGGTYGWGGLAVQLLPAPVAPAAISSPTYDTATPWIALAGAAGRSQHPPETTEFETAGTFTYTIPSWVIDGDYIDIVPIGAGAGGDYYGALSSPIIAGTTDPAYQYGGLAGSWNPVRLRYGDDYDIPTGTTTFSVTVGTPGAAAIANHATHTPQRGGAGGNTTVTISGYPIITAAGGAVPATSGTNGKSPGNVVFQGVQYFGGRGGTSLSSGPEAATSPGAGGARGVSVHNGYQSSDFDSTPGAPGACYITAVQN